MNEKILIPALLILFFAGFFIYYLTRRLKMVYPDTFKGFASFKVLLGYYKTAIEKVAANRWLIIFPVGLLVLTVIINFIPMLLIYGSEMLSTFFSFEGFSGIFQGFTLEGIVHELLSLPGYLNHVFYRFLLNNVLLILVVLIGLLIFKRPFSQQVDAEDESAEAKQINLKDNVLSLILIVNSLGIFAFGFLLFRGMADYTNTQDVFQFILNLVLVMATLVSLSLVQGVLFFAFKRILAEEAYSRDSLLDDSISKFKDLFLVNCVVYFISYLANFLTYIREGLDYAPAVVKFILILCTLLAPLVVVFARTSVLQALKGSILFIASRFSKFFILIATGFLILLVPAFLELTFGQVVMGYFFQSIFYLIFDFLRIVFSVVFMLALFKFYIDEQEIKEEQEVTGVESSENI